MADLSPNTLDAALSPDRREVARRPIRTARRPRERVRLLGQFVDLVRPEEVLHQVEAWVAQGRKAVVANHNLNSLNLIRRNPAMAEFYRRADLVEVDSAPLIAFARLIGIHGRAFHRCTYLDWRDHFWSLADRKGWRVMYLGGAPGVAETARQRLAARYPGIEIVVRDGYFDAAPDSSGTAEVIAEITAFRPNILFVGMGMPRQEVWIGQTLDALPDSVIFSVGAAFDYEAGVQSAAPRWMGPLGLEWLYRLIRDPGRLARRYLIEPWGLADLIVADVATAIRGRLARG
jgi:N-acetylglucosaminyldiphosphoundecaprenol N-acetyl-beta-D-mannosaminyltransferase